MHSLEVPVPANAGGLADQLAGRFTQEYARRYGDSAALAFQAAEIFALRVRARMPAARRDVAPTPAPSSGTPICLAPVFWPDVGAYLDTRVHDGGGFADGDSVTGPALVELAHTTIAVPRAATLTADRGHFRLLLPAPQSTMEGAGR